MIEANIIQLPEKLSVDKADEFRLQLNELLDENKNNLVINFADCTFIDSTGLGILVSVYKKVRAQGGTIKLCSINSPQIKKVFQLTRLDKVFEIEE